MQKVSRSIFAGLLVIAGLTACGDKVTVAPGGGTSTSTTPQVHSVTITPATVTLGAGQTVQLVATVNADAGLARTVTWTSTNTSIATVNASGLVTASATGSGTVAITATSTADPTVSGAASIIVTPTTAATISIASINQNGLPANLNNVTGQLDVTLNVDQGTQTVTALNLLVKSIATGAVDTVATYTFTSAQKAPATSGASATSAPITMSFNTASYNDTTGAVKFVNGQYTIQAQAVVAGASQSPVSSTMQYTVNNSDFMNVMAHGDTVATDASGRQWTAGNITVTVIPVLYSGRGLLNAVVSQPAAFTDTQTKTLTTFPGSAVFAVGTDTLTDSTYVAFVTAKYSDATQFNNGNAVNANQIRVDNAAPTKAAAFALGGTDSTTLTGTLVVPWVNAAYTFSKGLSKVVDSSNTGGTGIGVGGVTTTFYAIPNGVAAGDTLLTTGSASGWAACTPPSNAIVATTGASITQQSMPGDTTTYLGRAVSTDKLGNVVCQDLNYINNGNPARITVFGVDNTPPVNSVLDATSAQQGDTSSVSAATIGNWVWVLQDSISGFSSPPTIMGTIVRNYWNNATGCFLAGSWNATKKTCNPVALTQNMVVDGGNGNEGYFMMNSTVSDIAGNSATVPSATVLYDATAPQAGTAGSIPNAIGGTGPITYTGTVTDNVDLVGSYGYIVYPAGNLWISTSISPSHASFSGSRDTVGTVTGTVDSSFISSLAVVNGSNAPQSSTLASGHPTAVMLLGIDGTQHQGGDNIAPTVTDTTGAEVWSTAMFAHFLETNAAGTNISNGSGSNPTSLSLTAQVDGATAALGVPFTKVCWFYQDQNAAGAFHLISCQNLAVATQQPGGTNTWDWTSPTAFDPPASLGKTAVVNIIAVGYGHGGSALTSLAVGAIQLTN